MTKAQLETLKPEIHYVIFAAWPYRVAGIEGPYILIYDEEPDSLHVDRVLASQCKWIDREKALKFLKSE